MKYEIEYEETIKRINSVTIEVEDEDGGEDIADELYEKARDFSIQMIYSQHLPIWE